MLELYGHQMFDKVHKSLIQEAAESRTNMIKTTQKKREKSIPHF